MLIPSDETFRVLAEQLPNMIFINRADQVVYTNEISEKIMGYTREEFYSPDFDFLVTIAPESLETVRSAFGKHMKGENVKPHELTLITKDGETIKAINAPRLIDYEGEKAILGVITDITEQKKVEEHLAESELQYQDLFNSMREGFALCEIICDKKGTPINYRFLKINPAFEIQSGISVTAILGKTIKEIYPEIEPKWIERYGRVALTQETIQFEDYDRKTKKYYDAIVFSPSEGKFAMIFRDITDRKYADEELHKKMHTVEKMNKFMTGRELKMIELKDEVDELLEKAGELKKYHPSKKDNQ